MRTLSPSEMPGTHEDPLIRLAQENDLGQQELGDAVLLCSEKTTRIVSLRSVLQFSPINFANTAAGTPLVLQRNNRSKGCHSTKAWN